MKKMNKKGFTLVELLAVIVILALIMGIAIVSMSGVLNSAKESTMRETAASIISGVRNNLVLNNKLVTGDYYFDRSMLEKGGEDSPFGGKYKYGAYSDSKIGNVTVDKVSTGVYKVKDESSISCSKDAISFVHISSSNGTYEYKICLSDGENYMFDTESNLLSGNAKLNPSDEN